MIEHTWRSFRRFLRASDAVSALEYALLVGIMTVFLGAALATFGGNIQTTIAGIGADVITRGGLVTGVPTPGKRSGMPCRNRFPGSPLPAPIRSPTPIHRRG